MTDALVVVLAGRIAGHLTRERETITLDYDDAYLRATDATPLSLSMPLEVPRHTDAVVTPWLWGLLPDNPTVLSRWARQFEVPVSSAFQLLATPIGEDCAGAAQLVRPQRLDATLAGDGSIEWLDDEGVATRVAELRTDASAWLGADFTGQFSLAGAQAKTALHYDGTRWGVPRGAIPTTHILKPAIVGFDDHDLNEHLCLRAAHTLGLTTARTRIESFGTERAVVVDRYDRDRRHDELVRVHQEDVCQALAVHPGAKYESDGGPGVRDVTRFIRTSIAPTTAAHTAIAQFRDALIWNWLIGGTDAHAKNYSVLLAGRDVRLAPFYDIASALPYDGVDELRLRTAMKMGGEYRFKAQALATWEKVATDLGLDPEATCARVRELASQAPDALSAVARSDDVTALDSALPSRLVDAVASRTRRYQH